MDKRIVVYHSPKPYNNKDTYENANSPEYIFFLSSDNILFESFGGKERKLYWFAESIGHAKSHANFWVDTDNNKKRLTLQCSIPQTSHIDQPGIYCNVASPDIIIEKKIWF